MTEWQHQQADKLYVCTHYLLLLLGRFSRVWLCATPETAAHQAPRPWDSPGKSTGVGCHFLLQCMTVKSESEVTQLCPTLRDPIDCSLPGSSVHGIFQARVLEWGAIARTIIKALQRNILKLLIIQNEILKSVQVNLQEGRKNENSQVRNERNKK